MKKAKRYDNGGMTDEDVKSFAGTSDNDSNEGMAESTKEEAAPAKKQTFSEAFAAARKGGGKTFEFEGKKFTTELAGSKSSAPKATKASNEDYGNEGKRPARKATSVAARNILEEAKENVRRGNAARSSMSTAANQMEVGRLPKKGPGLSNFKSGGMTASRRADGIASKGKTRGKLC